MEGENHSAAAGDPLSNYLANLTQKPLDKDEEIALARIIQENQPEAREAREILIKAHLKLVVSIARQLHQPGIELADLISEGNIGLIKAVERYNPGEDCKLSTYACWWIRQHILEAIGEQSKTIRMPPHAIDKHRRVVKIVAELTNEKQRPPSFEEIGAETGIPASKVEEILQWGNKPLSLNYTDESSNTPLGELLKDEAAKNPLHELLKKSDAQWILDLLEELAPREQCILQKRYGIQQPESMTLDAIGVEMGITRERVRQIEARALKKLRKKIHCIQSQAQIHPNQKQKQNPHQQRD